MDRKPIVLLINNSSDNISSCMLEVEKISSDIISLTPDKYNYIEMLALCNNLINDRDNGRDILILSGTGFKSEMYIEMNETLYITERHCAVTTRGTDMGFQSIPVTEHLSGVSYSNEKSLECFYSIKDKLPKYYVIPFPSLKCTLLRGNLVNKLGFFDNDSLNFEDALINWCLRMNQYGFSTIVSNKIFIENSGSVKFNDFSYLLKFPYVSKLVEDYIKYSISPYDKFASVVSPTFYEKPRVLLSAYQLNPVYNGTSEHAFAVISRLIENYSDKYEFFILISNDNDKFFKVSERFVNVVNPENISGVFHAGMTFAQVYMTGHLLILNQHCLKIMPTVLDLISYRCGQLATLTDIQIFKKSIEYADSIITISEFTKRDLEAVFFTNSKYSDVNIHAIPIAMPDRIPADKVENTILPFDDYVLIFGFTTKHKLLKEVYKYLSDINANFIIVGRPIREHAKNIFCYESGSLSYEYINKLYMNCKCLLYPSIYEGYGLPVINALEYNRKVIVSRTEVNAELQKLFPQCKDNFIFFDSFTEIKNILEKTDFSAPLEKIDMGYTYDDTVRRTENVLAELTITPVNESRFLARHEVLTLADYAGLVSFSLVKKYIRQNYPFTFKVLKGVRLTYFGAKGLLTSFKRKFKK